MRKQNQNKQGQFGGGPKKFGRQERPESFEDLTNIVPRVSVFQQMAENNLINSESLGKFENQKSIGVIAETLLVPSKFAKKQSPHKDPAVDQDSIYLKEEWSDLDDEEANYEAAGNAPVDTEIRERIAEVMDEISLPSETTERAEELLK